MDIGIQFLDLVPVYPLNSQAGTFSLRQRIQQFFGKTRAFSYKYTLDGVCAVVAQELQHAFSPGEQMPLCNGG